MNRFHNAIYMFVPWYYNIIVEYSNACIYFIKIIIKQSNGGRCRSDCHTRWRIGWDGQETKKARNSHLVKNQLMYCIVKIIY